MHLKSNAKKAVVFLLVLLVGVLTGSIATASTNRLDDLRNEPSPIFPKNQSGQTYGSLGDVSVYGTEPVLVKALGVDGTEGYLYYTDLCGPEPKTLAEAAQQTEQAKVAKRIPLYKEDGKTVIGEFEMGPGEVHETTAEGDSNAN